MTTTDSLIGRLHSETRVGSAKPLERGLNTLGLQNNSGALSSSMELPLTHEFRRRGQFSMNRHLLHLTALLAAAFGNLLLAQSSLVLSSGTVVSGGSVSLNFSMTSPAGSGPAALQWTFSYPSAAFASFTVGAGPSLTAANKSIACSGDGSSYTCLAYGMNATQIANGVIAIVSVTPAAGVSTVAIGATNALGATPTADAIAITATGGTVSVIPSPTLSAINCSAATLTSAQTSTCTVVLNAVAGSASTVVLSSSAASLAVPASVSVPAGVISATFSASAGAVTSDQTATVTASLNGSSKSVGISLMASPAISSLQCLPTCLLQNSSAVCTVAIDQAAPAGGAVISIVSNNAALSVPASLTVPQNLTSATFSAVTGAFAGPQSATLTATSGTGSKTAAVTLALPGVLSTLTCSPLVLIPAGSGSCTVSLGSVVSVPTVISLASTNSSFHVPSTVSVPAGVGGSTFNFTTDTNLRGWAILSAAVGTTKKAVSFSTTNDTTPPSVSVTAPQNGAIVAGTTVLTANATGNVAVTAVQFELDGADLGATVTGAGPTYSLSWNAAAVTNGPHTLSAVAVNAAAIAGASGSVSVTVNNPMPPVISGIAAAAITASGATITWTTDKAADSQVAYGVTAAYGSGSVLDPTLVTSHTINLTGLAAQTIYHYKVVSRDAQGRMTQSGDLTLTTSAPAGPQVLFQLHSEASEVSGVTNGSIVTPAIAPPGFTGMVVVNGGGSVNFAPAQAGNGVYFLKCCGNTDSAFYRFTGTTVGSIFNVNQGQISFYLKSRQSFAQRVASKTPSRFVLYVRDANTYLFYFNTLASSGSLWFGYMLAGASTSYVVPPGTEEALFGNGITLKVTMAWDGSVAKLYLNDTLVQQFSYATPTPNWGAASSFDFGAYEYLTAGAFNACDDIIDEFTVTGPAILPAPLISSASMAQRSEMETADWPVITRLQNGADKAAPAACSPEAVATLIGRFLPEDVAPVSDRSGRATSLAGARVLINGRYVPVLHASPTQIEFLCPAVPPATALAIAVETAAGLSNRIETRVEEASPGIFATGGWTGGSDLLLPGGTVSIRATGMNWLAKFPTVLPFVRIGTQYVPIESITPDPQDAGVCTLTVTLPSDISGGPVPVVIEVVQSDGRSVASNPASIPIETRQRPASRPFIVQ